MKQFPCQNILFPTGELMQGAFSFTAIRRRKTAPFFPRAG